MQYTCEFCLKSGGILLHHGCVYWVRHKRREYSTSTAMAAASARIEYCYGCCISQERISSCLAHSGFSEQCRQCEQRDNRRHEQDQQYNWKSRQDAQQVGEPEAPLVGGSH